MAGLLRGVRPMGDWSTSITLSTCSSPWSRSKRPGGASAPSVLSMQWDKFTPRDDVALVVVGGGLTWAHGLVRFEGTT